MSDAVRRIAVPSRLDLWRYRAANRAKRLLRAWRYVTGRLSPDEAQWIMFECERPAGHYPLLTLTIEETLAQARETFSGHPALPRLIAEACDRVASRWESHNDDLWEARRWAIDLAEGYAAREGITLIRLDEDDVAPHAGVADEGGAP